jgi:hypothetical protein
MIATAFAATVCAWDHPGADPYRGPVRESVSAAVARYPDIPPQARAQLVEKARLLQPDGIVTITRTELASNDGTAANLRDMHHGSGPRAGVCAGPVTRNGWSDSHAETALVYCAESHCIAVPIVCGNVARIDFERWTQAEIPHQEPLPEPRQWDAPLWLLPLPLILPLPDPADVPRWRSAVPQISTAPHRVPEPSTLGMVTLALVALALMRRGKTP